MQTIRALPELRRARAALPGTVAFVPTMGALHDGHLALVTEGKRRADHVVASIFVNPLQFGPNEDLARYPRQEAEDAAKLVEAGVALLWAPGVEAMYPDGFKTSVRVAELGDVLDGAHRPGHFDGVATVVAKLFNQVRPDVALFGEKDWQQLAIVSRMAADLDFPLDIVGVPTVREVDGLARSSRNVYLSAEQRAAAVALPRTLERSAARIEAGEGVAPVLADGVAQLEQAGFAIDYLTLVDADLQTVDALAGEARLLVAARLGTTRLIDNVTVKRSPPR